MNTSYRAGLLAMMLLFFTGQLFAQPAGSDDLVRADKQFDLYAYNLALRTYEEVLMKDPNNAHAIARVGDCYFQLNKPDASLEYYQRAVQLRDAEPDASLRYGVALMHTGDYVGAKKQFRFYSDVNQTLGDHYLSMCDYAIQTTKKDASYTARNEPSNTDAADYSPAFYGSRITFNSARTDITRKMQSKSSADWTGSAYNQLFVTQRNPEGGFLQKPVFLRSDLQNAFNEGPVSFSGDGKKVAFCRNNFINGTRQIAAKGISMSLYTADVDANGAWNNVKAFQYNGSDYATGFPSLSSDGKTLLFSSNQEGGYGGWDIYVSNWTSNGWSMPRNLGAPLNTPGNEVTPFYNGKYFYFSSDWHEGLGGLDVFRAELGQAEVKNIYQLGTGINSSRDDYGFVYNTDQNIGYLTSNRPGGRGNEDIWQINKKIVDVPESTTASSSVNIAPQTYSTTTQSVVAEQNSGYNHLFVTDDQGKPLNNVEVDFLDCGCGTGRTDGMGKYYFEALSRSVDCHVGLTREGFQDATIALYSFGKQNVLVAMTKDKRQEFVGKVLDMRTKEPLYSVIVQFQVPGTDRLIQTSTDIDGRYSIFVESGTAYEMLYSKEGFTDATVKVRPGQQSGGTNRLQDVLMDRMNAGYTTYNTNTPQPTTAPITYSTETTTPTTTLYAPKTAKEEAPFLGYAIQLAASPVQLPAAKLSKFEELSNSGNIYAKTESGINKVRLGVFSNKEDAQKKLKEINKKPGYKDAFLVEEHGTDQSLVLGSKAQDASPIRPTEYSTPGNATPVNAKGFTPAICYAVQLGSFAPNKAINVLDYSSIASLGNVYTKVENGMTKIRLGVWPDYADAEAAQNESVAHGFKDATVVTEKGNDESIQGFLLNSIGTPSKISPAPYQSGNKGFTDLRPTEYNASVNPNVTGPYYVKIAALSNPERFDEKPLSDIAGNIEKRKIDNGMTLILLGGYPDLATATMAQNRVRNKGYEGTYVIKDDKGKFVKQ